MTSWRLTSWSRWKISGKTASAPVSQTPHYRPPRNSFSASVRDTCLLRAASLGSWLSPPCSSGTPMLRPLPALSGRGPPATTPLGLPCAPCSRVTRSVCQSCVSLSGFWLSPPPSLSSFPCSLSSCPTPSLWRLPKLIFCFPICPPNFLLLF